MWRSSAALVFCSAGPRPPVGGMLHRWAVLHVGLVLQCLIDPLKGALWQRSFSKSVFKSEALDWMCMQSRLAQEVREEEIKLTKGTPRRGPLGIAETADEERSPVVRHGTGWWVGGCAPGHGCCA